MSGIDVSGMDEGRWSELGCDGRLWVAEVAHRQRLVDERIAAARLAALASGWDEAVVGFCVDRISAVHRGWAERWQKDGGEVVPYPSVAEFAVEVGRWCDAYAEMLEGLPPLLKAANGRRVADVERERERADAAAGRFDAAAAEMRRSGAGRKPSDALPCEQLVDMMKRICGSDAVTERTLRRWLHAGRSASGFCISYEDTISEQSWEAWCKSFFAHETGRLRIRQFFDERRDGAVGDVPARPVR